MEDGDQKSHSVPFQSYESIEERGSVRSLDKRFEGLAAPRKPGQARKTCQMIRRCVGIAQETEYEPNRPFVESWVFESLWMGRSCHGEAPETMNLRVRHCNATANASREDRLTLEKSGYHLLA